MNRIDETISQIERIIEYRRSKTGSDWSTFVTSDYRKAFIWMCALSDEEKELVLQHFGYNEFVAFVSKMSIPQVDYIPPQKDNTPVKQLLKWYADKNSKKVSLSKQEMIKRYEYLDKGDQTKFRIALLQSPSLSDNVLGCRYCLKRWAGKELPHIHELWQKSFAVKDNELWILTSRLLIRHEVHKFLLDNQSQLTQRDAYVDSKLYYHLCLRLASEKRFTICKNNMSIDDYYRWIYYTNLPLNEIEWEEDIYYSMAIIYAEALYYPKDRSPLVISIPANEKQRWNNQSERLLSLCEFPNVHKLLLYAAKMKCSKVNEVMDYITKVDSAMSLDDKDPETLYQWCPPQYKHYFKDRKDEIMLLIKRKNERIGFDFGNNLPIFLGEDNKFVLQD